MRRRLSPWIVHRETVRLAVLIAVVAAVFAVTRAVAQSRRAAERADAVAWHARGGAALADGRIEDAAAAFRRAVSLQPDQPVYALSLADALLRAGNPDAAARVLLRLRDRTPDDAAVNTALARLSAVRRDLAGAVRYYHNALYAPWSSAEEPRELRLELIRFLLDSGDSRRAVSELIAATTDVPARAGAHLQMARLFFEAGEIRRARDYFMSTLRMEPRNAQAIEGAIHASFQLGDYARVTSYTVPAAAGADTRQRVAVAHLVLTHDPLARRLGGAARARRLNALLARVRERYAACIAQFGAPPPAAATLMRAIDARRFERAAATRDADALEDGVRMAASATRELDSACGAPASLDVAIRLMAQAHALDNVDDAAIPTEGTNRE